MSYHDAPSTGLKAIFDVKAGEPLLVKMAKLNGQDYNSFRLPHSTFANGGILELWLDSGKGAAV